MNRDPKELELVSDALLDAFNYFELERLLLFHLGRDLSAITLAKNLEGVVFDLVTTAQRQAWIDRLIIAARAANPGNDRLFTAAQALGLAPATPTGAQLERLVRDAEFYDPAVWRSRLAELEGRVCRIEIATTGILASGFLVADDAVLTNYHVVKDVVEGHTPPSCVGLRFDYKVSADGAPHEGTLCELAPEGWLIDASPYHPLDLEPSPPASPRSADHLDHALLRLDRALGRQPIGGGGSSGAPKRGAIPLPAQDHHFAPGQPLLILQHPEGAPLKLASEGEVLSVNQDGTRVRYGTNTLPGSSGSPCFGAGWELVALHHSGDPRWPPGNRGDYNQGIPVAALRRRLRKRGILEPLSTGPTHGGAAPA